MDSLVVRQSVRAFLEATAFTGGEAHSFAPWYLHQKYGISEGQALQQASDGNYDFGVDAFHLTKEADGTVSGIVLVQAKYTESLQQIAKGFRDLERSLHEIARSLAAVGTEAPIQNKVLVNLRAAINRLPPEARAALKIDLEISHISMEDEAVLGVRFREPMNRLKEAVEEQFEGHVCRIRPVGPSALGRPQIVVAPPEAVTFDIEGLHEFPGGENSRRFSGMVPLSELVELYKSRRDNLFSRNVRYYLQSKQNTEKGPAAKMRATLKQICVEKDVSPESFGLFHNGVTIYSRRCQLEAGKIRIREPYVLNGCQTIKNAFLFRVDGNLKSKIDQSIWLRVMVPIRIIETASDELLRAITVNNNRQNSMSPSALRSNDPVQIRLEQRFKNRQMFYQRQEGAFDNFWAMQPELLEDEYENTRGTWIDIRELARSIAAASGEIGIALRPNDLWAPRRIAQCGAYR